VYIDFEPPSRANDSPMGTTASSSLLAPTQSTQKSADAFKSVGETTPSLDLTTSNGPKPVDDAIPVNVKPPAPMKEEVVTHSTPPIITEPNHKILGFPPTKHTEGAPKVLVGDPVLDPATHHTAEDTASDWVVPDGPPTPNADDMMAASIVPDNAETIHPNQAQEHPNPETLPNLGAIVKRILGFETRSAGSGSTAARRAAQQKSKGNEGKSGKKAAASNSEDKGYQDGYAAALAFGQFGGSRLGFATQYMEDTIAALLASEDLEHGAANEYRKTFVKGLADGENKVVEGDVEGPP
jgi:hypothetical protein